MVEWIKKDMGKEKWVNGWVVMMSEEKCWEIKESCMMKGQPHDKSGCPAYRDQKGCWETNWREIIEGFTADQKEFWYSFLDKCPSCVVYARHPVEMQRRINEVKSLFIND